MNQTEPTEAAKRAAHALPDSTDGCTARQERKHELECARIIDAETGLPELIEACKAAKALLAIYWGVKTKEAFTRRDETTSRLDAALKKTGVQ